MNSIQKLTLILQIILVILVVVCAIAGLVVFWYMKVKKPGRMKEAEVDYSGLKRTDSIDYSKFDSIEDDMIVTNNNRVFHAAIQCRGFDFFSAAPQEQIIARNGYLSFVSTITDEIYYRQYTKKVDLDDTINSYKSALDNTEEKLYNITMDFNNIQEQYVSEREKCLQEDKEMDVERELGYLNELERLSILINNFTWRRADLENNIRYAENMSENTAPERVETYFFKWVYEPVIGRELSEEQIYMKAKRELNRMANSYIYALSSAGVRSVRVKTNQLRQMYRRHWHPGTADLYKSVEVENSSFYKDVVSSSVMLDVEYEIAMDTGVINEVYDAQEKLEKEGRDPESMTLDELLLYENGAIDTDNKNLTIQDIDKRKDSIKQKKAATEVHQVEENQNLKKNEDIQETNNEDITKSSAKVDSEECDIDFGIFSFGQNL